MSYHVYMLISLSGKKHTYVGYTNNLAKRIDLHNKSKGAKFTKGRKLENWTELSSSVLRIAQGQFKREFTILSENAHRQGRAITGFKFYCEWTNITWSMLDMPDKPKLSSG